MFQKARLTLTAWYVLIIMIVSIFFSTAFYNIATQEVQRVIQRIEHEHNDPYDLYPNRPPIDIQTLRESEQHVLFILILINLTILVFAGGAAYFLAGETLRPIQRMVNEQNRFITDASHELRTPLTAAKTSIEVGLRDKHLSTKDAKDLLLGTLEDLSSIQLLAEDLLTLAQFQTNTKQLFEPVAISEVIQKATSKVNPMAKQKYISIDFAPNSYQVNGNKENLLELFIILLDNAIKYSPKKSTITVTVKKPDHHILATIEDQGIGIDEKDLPHIFDRFYRSDKSRVKTTPGYGLGLSIAKKIVETHNGSISVQTTKDVGTKFSIKLPITA